jgi:hypothetical protein
VGGPPILEGDLIVTLTPAPGYDAYQQHGRGDQREPQRAAGRQGAQRQGGASVGEQQDQPRAAAQVLLGTPQRGHAECPRGG